MTELQTPFVGSILLASTDPSRLRAWYQRAFDVPPDTDGFVRLGEVGLLSVPRDDVAASTAEPTPAYWSARHQRAPQAGRGPLADAAVSARLPAQDLDRARQFYAEKLGVEPAEERPGGLRYQCRAGTFSIFHSGGRPAGTHTQLAWQVGDLDAVVTELRQRGIAFEDVDTPGLRTTGGIAEVTGNYPSAGGGGERAAWFRDSEGNLLGIGQAITAGT